MRGVTTDNLAYVSYTSGSTGRPKGVCINQRSVIRLVKNTNYASFTADRVFLQFAPLAFEASTLELWGPLLNGAKLVIMPPQTPSLEELGNAIRQHKVTTLWLTAGLFNQMVDERLEDLSSVHQLLAGGDVLSVPHVRKVLQELKDCQLINGYGPTENTTFTCCFPITESQIGASVPIGRPIANTQVYILDNYLQPVPVGVPGELHIAGTGLARSYLNRPELTTEKFIPNPFSDDPGSRLYKTGDLVRYRLDGNIEFLGRFDNQVKIRGFRIELGEIETILAQHSAVQEVVVVRKYQSNDKRLVAYFVPHQEPITSTVLRDFIRERLPDYMIPSSFVMLKSLPLTPNKKVDRRALPAPDVHRRDEKGTIGPRDNVELRLVQIWEEILEVSPVSVKDDFFELGGYSLLAVKLMSQIQQQFGKNLPLTVLFQHSTIEQLAGVLHLQVDTLPWSPLVAIQPKGSKPPLFGVHPAGGRVLGYVDLARYLGPEQPFYGLQAWGFEEGQKPFFQAKNMAASYIEALRTIHPDGPYHITGWSGGGVVAFEMAQQLQSVGKEVPFLALLDAYSPSILPDDLSKQDEAQIIMNLLGEEISYLSVDYMRQMTHDELLAYVTNQLIAANLIPPDFGIDQVQRFLNVYKANIQAAHSSISQHYRGKIILVRAEAEESLASRYSPQDPTLGWGAFATNGVEICRVPGNHNTMMGKPHVEVLAQRLRHYLLSETE